MAQTGLEYLKKFLFMLPVYIVIGLSSLFPDDVNLRWAVENMDTTHTLGIGVYVAVLYIITVAFSFVFISPKTLAENLQKAGDSITGLRAGKRTRKYISIRVVLISLFSATFFSMFIGIPLVLQLNGYISPSVMSLPSVLIAMASINCNLYREMRAVKDFDAYIPFL